MLRDASFVHMMTWNEPEERLGERVPAVVDVDAAREPTMDRPCHARRGWQDESGYVQHANDAFPDEQQRSEDESAPDQSAGHRATSRETPRGPSSTRRISRTSAQNCGAS